MTWPVRLLDELRFRPPQLATPIVAATFAGRPGGRREVRIRTGSTSPSARAAANSRLFAIAPTSQPSASAASAAVCTESGSTTIRPAPPSAARVVPEVGDRGVLGGSEAHGAERIPRARISRLTSCRRGGVPWTHSNTCSNTLRWRVTSTPILHRGTDRPSRDERKEQTVRTYDDLVEVRKGPVPGYGADGPADAPIDVRPEVRLATCPEDGPQQFLWRGRLWQVREIVAHWVEVGAWWLRRPEDASRAFRAGPRAGGLAGDRGARAGRSRLPTTRVSASSTSPSTEPRASGASPAPWTEPRCRPMNVHLPAATHSYLERSAESLREAITCSDVPQRYALAHVVALRATAALLAARAQPMPRRSGAAEERLGPAHRGRPRVHRVGDVLLRRRAEALRSGGRLPTRGDRARGRRPGP